MKSNPVGWFEIYVQDVPRARAFYEAVFQGTLEELKNPDPEGFPEMEMWARRFRPAPRGAVLGHVLIALNEDQSYCLQYRQPSQ